MLDKWLLMRCSCSHAFGSQQGGASRCPKCGKYVASEIGSFEEASLLAEAVASANLPKELAHVISQRSPSSLAHDTDKHRVRPSTTVLRRVMISATSNDGSLTISTLQSELSIQGIVEPDAAQLIGQAEMEGALLRNDPDTWVWLQQSS